jgi:hypothetical protein
MLREACMLYIILQKFTTRAIGHLTPYFGYEGRSNGCVPVSSQARGATHCNERMLLIVLDMLNTTAQRMLLSTTHRPNKHPSFNPLNTFFSYSLESELNSTKQSRNSTS